MNWFLLVIFSGIISVDRRAGLHMMISRPLPVALVVGLLTDNIHLCLLAGIMIEIYGSVDLPVGTRIPKDDTFFSYVISLVIGLQVVDRPEEILVAIFLCLVFIYPVTFLEYLLRKINNSMLHSFISKNMQSSAKIIFYGIFLPFLMGVIVYNGIFFGIAFILNQLKFGLKMEDSIPLYLVLLSVFLAGYPVRFFSLKSIYKYVFFIVGASLGWALL